MQPNQRIHPHQLFRAGLILGAALTGAGVFWMGVIRRENPVIAWYPPQTALLEIGLGIVIGLAAAGIALLMAYYFPALRRLRDMMMELIYFDEVTLKHALLFGLIAGIPEEIFFRGVLQPELGLLAAAFIFGMLHFITPLYFVYTFLAGLGLGLLTHWRGDLWASTTAHAVYDAALFIAGIYQYTRLNDARLETNHRPLTD